MISCRRICYSWKTGCPGTGATSKWPGCSQAGLINQHPRLDWSSISAKVGIQQHEWFSRKGKRSMPRAITAGGMDHLSHRPVARFRIMGALGSSRDFADCG